MRLVHSRFAAITAVVAAFAILPSVVRADDDDPRVYLRLAEGITQPLSAAHDALVDALGESGWNVLSTMDCGVVEDQCDFGSKVVVAYMDQHRERLMAYGNHAAYALPVRFIVYEDENGVGLGATNPMNLNRTIVDEDTEPEDWADMAVDIRTVAALAFPDQMVDSEYGQRRGNARIGRTFGIMAGGEFTTKFKDVVTRPLGGDNAAAIAQELFEGMEALGGEWDWDIRPIYVLDIPENNMAVLGVSSLRMEARSAGIVRHGGMDDREDMACPGIDHSAAYPVEVVIQEVDGELQIRLVDIMFRMKMFYEDAGKMSFARNMGMPGSIEDEIKDKIRAVLGN